MKKGRKEEIFTVLGGKISFKKKRGWGKNINYLDNIHPCLNEEGLLFHRSGTLVKQMWKEGRKLKLNLVVNTDNLKFLRTVNCHEPFIQV